ncbi:MAG TPA: hypothetical protein VK181_04460 [Rhizobium sp.]|nr:hypothetical protein [Rhizobium sp.]
MPSQHSQTARLHPGYETDIQRQRREASEELSAFLAKAAALRARIASSRILIAGQGPSPCPGR